MSSQKKSIPKMKRKSKKTVKANMLSQLASHIAVWFYLETNIPNLIVVLEHSIFVAADYYTYDTKLSLPIDTEPLNMHGLIIIEMHGIINVEKDCWNK